MLNPQLKIGKSFHRSITTKIPTLRGRMRAVSGRILLQSGITTPGFQAKAKKKHILGTPSETRRIRAKLLSKEAQRQKTENGTITSQSNRQNTTNEQKKFSTIQNIFHSYIPRTVPSRQQAESVLFTKLLAIRSVIYKKSLIKFCKAKCFRLQLPVKGESHQCPEDYVDRREIKIIII